MGHLIADLEATLERVRRDRQQALRDHAYLYAEELATRINYLENRIWHLSITVPSSLDTALPAALVEKPPARSRVRLHHPPGSLLLRCAEFVCSRRTFQEVFEPTITDLQAEYYEALAAQRRWKAQWVRFRGYSRSSPPRDSPRGFDSASC